MSGNFQLDIAFLALYNIILYQNGQLCLLREIVYHIASKKSICYRKNHRNFPKFLWYLTNRKWMNGVIMPMVNVKPVKLGKMSG